MTTESCIVCKEQQSIICDGLFVLVSNYWSERLLQNMLDIARHSSILVTEQYVVRCLMANFMLAISSGSAETILPSPSFRPVSQPEAVQGLCGDVQEVTGVS